MSLDRSIRWRGFDPVSIEHCHVVSTPRDTRIRGTVVTATYGLFYRIKLDDTEHVRTVKLERTDGAVLELFSDGMGNGPMIAPSRSRRCAAASISISGQRPSPIPCPSGAANGSSGSRSALPLPGSTATQ